MKLTQIMNENQENRPLSNEVKKHFLEIVSTYNKYQEMMDRKSDLATVAETLGGITEAARTLAIHEGDDWFDKPHPVGMFKTTCTIPANFLNEGSYSINAIILTDVTHAEVAVKEVLSFTVHETGTMRKEFTGQWIGSIRPRLAWQTKLTKSSLEA